ncbi:NAD(P)H-hydrate dehydratase [Aliikangiella sp. IMCC44359]|uniref:NAD(P)H-hydrate dehydratase n=1 Tax=Aliikangiella sp. IMCC44359 TaxID=3459125 RepID=UPI00403ACCAC
MKSHFIESNVPLYKVEQIQQVERFYADINGNGTFPLMQLAGKSAFDLMCQKWPQIQKLIVLVGKGNNGGDGLIVAKHASQSGIEVDLCFLCDPKALKGDALTAFNQLPSHLHHQSWSQLDWSHYDVVIDALLGTGVQGEVKSPIKEAIEQINQSRLPVLSIDIPSGINANTGACTNVAVKATVTATYIGYKKGMYTGDAANYRGQVRLYPLGTSAECWQNQMAEVYAHDWDSLKFQLKPRELSSHKGNFGHCRVIGGASGMTGAALLASKAAARVGSGLTSAWVEQDAGVITAHCPEVMARCASINQIPDWVKTELSLVSSLVVGPGLGQSDWSKQWMQQLQRSLLLEQINKVYDADALNYLASHHHVDHRRILTPHPGEAGRLLGVSAFEINQDRYAASLAIAKKYGGVCILKGAGTVISDATGKQVVCPVGNPGMASGGMGDVLSGVIGGLLAQGFDLFDAAQLGVCIHGEAADRAAGESHLYRGMLASDLIEFFPLLLNPVAEYV